MKKINFKRITAYILTLVLLISALPLLNINSAKAATPHTRVVDASTLRAWENYFGEKVLNTENAGGVWGDKSVFLSAEDFNDATEESTPDYPITMKGEQDNFLVALSAMASNKSIVGYTALPTDTVFVLDLSNSMSDASMTAMVKAANASIHKLLTLNPENNRIGVVVYSGIRIANQWVYGVNESATILLPLGKYKGTGSDNATYLTYENDHVAVAKGVLGAQTPSKEAIGATYLQAGLQLALNSFNAVKNDVTVQSGPQAGTVRTPILVLMSDGAPTVATTSINNVATSTHGDGNYSTTVTSYLTQLTAAYTKQQMAEIYGRSPLFYTLGLNVGDSATATGVLDPMNAADPYPSYWSAYDNAAKSGKTTLSQTAADTDFTVPVIKELDRNYVDRYFPASDDASLIASFQQIVDQIILQSKYYPTKVEDGQHHLDGYITFTDELGLFMEVKDIKGITVQNTLYPGSAIVREMKQGTFGDIYSGNLGNMNTAGAAFLEAVEKRLGCTRTQAGEVVSQALRAGQLYYNSQEDFSNYIGWYADEQGNFMGFWNGKDHSARPSGAVYANKSYGFMGKVGSAEEYNETDMLHISVQVRTHIEWQHQVVLYKIPAALIPTVNYNIAFEGDSLEQGTNFRMEVKGAKEPIRLIYEAGLKEDINPINVTAKIEEYEKQTGEAYPYAENGVYHFYSNAWNEHEHKVGELTDSHEAAYFDFVPSYENEKYYFVANTPIYEQQNGEYRLTATDPVGSNQTYYAKTAVYTTEELGLTAARMEYRYVPITAEALKSAKADGKGGYYVPKGTVHRLMGVSQDNTYHVVKEGEDISTPEKTHPTKSLDYSSHPDMVLLSDGTVHCDTCLGNNGRLTLTSDQGIVLEKQVEVEGEAQGILFPFKVTLTPTPGQTLASTYPVYDETGVFMENVAVENGVLTLSLTAGQKVYLVNLPTNTEYRVEEIVADGWKVLESTNEQGTVAQNTYNYVSFLNGPISHGNLFLHKEIVISEAAGEVTWDEPFEVEVSFSGDHSFDTVTVDGVEKTLENGKLKENLLIKPNQTILLSGIPEGTVFTAREVDLPKGWKGDKEEYTGTVHYDQNTVAVLTNTYTPAMPSEINIHHTGVKTVLGREFLKSDEFSFRFEYFNGNSWIAYSEEQTVTGAMAQKEFSFDELLHGFIEDDTYNAYNFSKAGVYQFRIVENFTEIGGINYDQVPKRFAVEIQNNFETGALEVTNVTTVTPAPQATDENENPAGTVITKDEQGEFTVTTVFNNRYQTSNRIAFAINIQKELKNNTQREMGLDGFAFEVYQLDEQGQKVHSHLIGETNEEGYLLHHELLNEVAPGQIFTYYVAEVPGNVEGMEYVKEPVKLEVQLIDGLDGTLDAVINGKVTNECSLTFVNTYTEEQQGEPTTPTDKPGNGETPPAENPPTPPADDLPPKTGDLSVSGMAAAMTVLGVIGFGICLPRKKRKAK